MLDYYRTKYSGQVFIPFRFEYLKTLLRDRGQTKSQCPALVMPEADKKKQYLKIILPHEADRNVFSYCRLSDKALRDINSYLRSHFNEVFINYVTGYLAAQTRIISPDYKKHISDEISRYGITSSQKTSIVATVLESVKPQMQQNAIEEFMYLYEIEFTDNNYQALKKQWDRSLLKKTCLSEGNIRLIPSIGQKGRRKTTQQIQPQLFE